MSKLSRMTMELVNGTGEALRIVDKETAQAKLSSMLDFISRDLSLREPMDEYDKVGFIFYMRKYFSYLTLHDIKLMFELYAMKKLPGALLHYGKWSAEFYISVAESYVKVKQEAKVQYLASLPHKALPSALRTEVRKAFEQSMCDAFDNYKESGQLRAADKSYPVFDYWRKIFPHLNEAQPREQDMAMAVKELCESLGGKEHTFSQADKQARAVVLARHRAVVELYDRFIADGQHPLQFIKP